ncbi:TPA: peptide pheromone inhibitor Ipd, partial [Enterococcus faecalis]|nr:peptide pheromone inhibitor Ipd [Enterococcus faecalis]HAP3928990.1 peptide pheromone inhibitor Ipd [Enterococcus faecalis]HAP4202243.1 peptide pheromone inhibitor Ipd [Enterococcus faecalis]HAP4205382.1 peptide pheromone inhibitor Ipd [Enterococcus faecalis]HAP4378471.1 peptide pheromone inhibitor Ipd [Enterococcus faecalis]
KKHIAALLFALILTLVS